MHRGGAVAACVGVGAVHLTVGIHYAFHAEDDLCEVSAAVRELVVIKAVHLHDDAGISERGGVRYNLDLVAYIEVLLHASRCDDAVELRNGVRTDGCVGGIVAVKVCIAGGDAVRKCRSDIDRVDLHVGCDIVGGLVEAHPQCAALRGQVCAFIRRTAICLYGVCLEQSGTVPVSDRVCSGRFSVDGGDHRVGDDVRERSIPSDVGVGGVYS